MLLRIVLLLACLLPQPAGAQVPGLALPRPPVAAAPQPTDPAELQALVRTLQDDQARARLIAQLQALASAQPPSRDPALDQAVDRLGEEAAERVAAATETLSGLTASLEAVPQLLGWIGEQLTDPISRGLWWTVLSQTGLALGLGALAALGVHYPLRRWREARVAQLPLPRTSAKLQAALAHALTKLARLMAFVLVSYAALRLIEVAFLARLITTDIVRGIAFVRLLAAVWSAVLAPEQPERRLVPLADREALAVQRWLDLVLALAIYGYIGLDSALRLGLPWTVHTFLLHALFLVVISLVTAAILRLRPQVAALINAWGAEADSWLGRVVPWRFLATAGPYILIGWLFLQYLVWALQIPAGTALLTRGAAVTILALAALRVLHMAIERLIAPPPADALATAETDQRPMPARRAGVIVVLRLVAVAATLAVILQAWGVNIAGLLDSNLGREIVGRLAQFAAVTGMACLVWYVFDRGAVYYITAQDAEGNPIHSNRTRTLANLVRNVALTAAAFVVIGQLLAMVGVNTAALLAGAGVVGFAIGFGSQKLVQDLTTGLFILLGDTVRVGDVVQLGLLAGVVEAVSMRTMTLRDYNGHVHTIPYSSINIVTNMTKDYSFAVFDVLVGYEEDPDRIMQILREIDAQLRREWPYRRIMLEPIEIAGLDAFLDHGVLIKSRSKVRPGEQWKVLREFNLRLKRRFDELAIRRPFPQQTVHIPERERPVERHREPKLTAVVGRSGEARLAGEA